MRVLTSLPELPGIEAELPGLTVEQRRDLVEYLKSLYSTTGGFRRHLDPSCRPPRA